MQLNALWLAMTSSSNNGEDEPGVISDADRREIKARLEKLGGKIGAAQGNQPSDPPEGRGQAMGMAFRLSAEMIAGVAVGGLIGYALDKWLGSSPLALIVCLLLGAATGIYNAIRAAKAMQGKQ